MSFAKEFAAPGKHQSDGPPRLNSSRCGTNHIAAVGLNQSSSGVKKTFSSNQTGDNMTKTQVLITQNESVPATATHFNSKQIDILKNSICKGVSNEEFEVFIMACAKTQLDPFMRQIYAVKRKSKKPDGTWGETMTIQTGIDGYRLIAERTERYAPGPEPTYVYDNNGGLTSATAYIKKQTKDGTWHTVSASAYLDEYCQTFVDRQTGEKKPTGMWVNMQRTMLAKCAEAQALRKAFPAEMSGVYTKEEMAQADVEEITPRISLEQAADLDMILNECDEKYKAWVYDYLRKQYNTDNLSNLPADIFDRMKSAAVKNMEQNHAKQRAEAQPELIASEVQ